MQLNKFAWQSEGVGTLRIDEKPKAALSHELADDGTILNSDTSVSDEEEGMGWDATENEMSPSSDSSSAFNDAGEYTKDEGDDGDDYFDLAIGMSDGPKIGRDAEIPQDTSLITQSHFSKLQLHDDPHFQPSTPGGSKRKLPIPAFFKRSNSSKSVDTLSHANGMEVDGTSDMPSVLGHHAHASATTHSASTSPKPAYRRKRFTRRKVKLGNDGLRDNDALDVNNEHVKRTKNHRQKRSTTGRRRKTNEDSPTLGPGGYSLSTGATGDDLLGIVFLEGNVLFYKSGILSCRYSKQSKVQSICRAGAT